MYLTSLLFLGCSGFPRSTKVTTQTPLKSDFLAEVVYRIHREALIEPERT